MKQPKIPVTAETLEEGTPELAVYVETTSFAGKPVAKQEPVVPAPKGGAE
jgi:hypothetical protein